jgi:hypothetical protein
MAIFNMLVYQRVHVMETMQETEMELIVQMIVSALR